MDDGIRKRSLERGHSWISRALVGDKPGSVVAVCFIRERDLKGRAEITLNLSTIRAANTELRGVEDDVENSQNLVRLSNKLIRLLQPLLIFLIERSRKYDISGLSEQVQGLGFRFFEGSLKD